MNNMNYKLSFILIACSTFSNAQSIHIQSSATPEGISLEKYNQLTSSMNQSNEERAKSKINHAKRKADEQVRENAQAAAKAKADAAKKTKAYAATEAKAETDAKRKADLAPEIEAERSSAAQKANEAAAIKKAKAKKIASSAKRDFDNKIKNFWIIPENASGQKASARITLTDSGAVASFIVNSSNPEIKSSIEQAIRFAAPFTMPSDPDARHEARSFSSSFTVK